jgi:transmembrane sensor
MSSAELIEQEAGRWLAARDAGTPDAGQDAAFNQWIQADIRHRVAFRRLEAAWRRSDQLRDLRPLDRDVDAELLRPPRRHWSLAIAATVLLTAVATGFFFVNTRLGWQRYETRIGGFSRIVLEDGSVIDLNTDSDARVRLGSKQREVRLLRGEGRFQVAHDASRPFVVSAASADVRAVGTAFSVRLRSATQVDVLVSEGTVAIASARVPHAPPIKAGEAAVLLPDRMSVRRIEPQQIERSLAWTSGRLQFRGETLGEAVAEFNRYNRRQLRFADASLAQLHVGGTFNATDPESFAAALASTLSLRVDPGDPHTIVLQQP